VAAAALGAILSGVGACSTTHGATVQDATIYGKVLNAGPQGTTVVVARVQPHKSLKITFHAHTSKAGAFSLTVPPGEYVIASPPCFPTHERARLRAGSRARRNFNCEVS
jgi:hypothetical protein